MNIFYTVVIGLLICGCSGLRHVKYGKNLRAVLVVLLLPPLVIAIVELNQLDTKQEQGQGQTTYIISITKSSQMIFRSLMHWCMSSDSVVSSCVINMQTCRQIYGIQLDYLEAPITREVVFALTLNFLSNEVDSMFDIGL